MFEQVPHEYIDGGPAENPALVYADRPRTIRMSQAIPAALHANVEPFLARFELPADSYVSLGIILGDSDYMSSTLEMFDVRNTVLRGAYMQGVSLVLHESTATTAYSPLILLDSTVPADSLKFNLTHELGHLVADLKGEDVEPVLQYFNATDTGCLKKIAAAGMAGGVSLLAATAYVEEHIPHSAHVTRIIPAAMAAVATIITAASILTYVHPGDVIRDFDRNEQAADRFAFEDFDYPIIK